MAESEDGTFLSVDPVVASAGDPQSLNAYAYARNNPVSLTDPTGMCVIISHCATIDYGSSPGYSYSQTSSYNSSTGKWEHSATAVWTDSAVHFIDSSKVAWDVHAGMAPHSSSGFSGFAAFFPMVGSASRSVGRDGQAIPGNTYEITSEEIGTALAELYENASNLGFQGLPESLTTKGAIERSHGATRARHLRGLPFRRNARPR